MDKLYSFNELATITGLTTRTLRNYIKMDILSGEKIDGIWQFDSEQIEAFLHHPMAAPSIRAKKNVIVYDFMADTEKKQHEMCTILDLQADEKEAEEISGFFCNYINQNDMGNNIQFSFERHNPHIRIILKGSDREILNCLKTYYSL